MLTKKIAGVTLLELILAMTIVSIVAVLAIGSYSSYVKKGRRSDGLNALLSISLAEERYRSNNTQYGTLAQVWNGATTSPQGYYTLSITNISASGYTATATAIGNQAQDTDNGSSCTTLTLSMSSGTITRTPTNCWPN